MSESRERGALQGRQGARPKAGEVIWKSRLGPKFGGLYPTAGSWRRAWFVWR